jgi:hypothetical protein
MKAEVLKDHLDALLRIAQAGRATARRRFAARATLT